MTIEGLHDVRPGDIIFTGITKPLAASLLVKLGQLLLGERVRIGRRSLDHVIVVTKAARATTAGDAPFGELLMVPVPGQVAPLLHTLPEGVQAMPRGAEFVALTPDKHWTDRSAVVRLPEDYPGQGLDAAAVARAFVRRTPVAYSFASYVWLALWRYGIRARRLEARIARRRPLVIVAFPGRGYRVAIRLPEEAICSVLADQAWTLAGKDVVEGVADQAVTPGRLAMSLWRRPGVIWGGPGLL
jgi:hypothetical protein